MPSLNIKPVGHEDFDLGVPWNPGGSAPMKLTKAQVKELRTHLIRGLCLEDGGTVLFSFLSTLSVDQLIEINNRIPAIKDLLGETDDSPTDQSNKR